MAKFKVGDKVIRTGEDYGTAKKGKIYEVTGIRKDIFGNIEIEGDSEHTYDPENFELAPSDLPTDRPLTYDETQMLKAGDVIDCWYARNLIIKTISNSSIAFENETRKWGLSAKVKNTCGSIFFVSHGKEESKEEKKEEVKDFGLSEMAKGFIKTQAEQRVVDKMAGRNGLEKLDYESMMEAHINAHKEFLKRSTTKSVSQILYGR